MRSLNKRWILIGLLIIGALLYGCASTPATTPAPAVQPTTAPVVQPTQIPAPVPTQPVGADDRAKTFIIAVGGDLEGWDPTTVTYYLGNEMMQNTYDRLVEHEITKDEQGRAVAETTKFKPMLAEKFSVSDDNLTWTFSLRKGVKFSSGNELTSEDVLFTFNRTLEMNKGIMLTMLNIGGVKTASQMTAEDPYTFKIKLNEPNPLLLQILALGSNAGILDSKTVLQNQTPDDPFAEKWLRNHVAGSGPYVLDKSEAGNQVVYVANKTYWKGAPKIEKLIYKTIPASQDRLMLLMSGAVDAAYDLTSLDMTTTLKDAEGVQVQTFPSPTTAVLFFDNTKAPFNDVRVRKALCHATPYSTILDKVLYGLGSIPESPIAPGVIYRKSVIQCEYDPDKAKSLLAEAGLSNGFEMTVTFPVGRPEEEATATLLQAEFAKYGIRMEMEKLQMAAWSERRSAKTIEAGFDRYAPYAPDPNYALEFWYRTGGVLNSWQYSNPQVDQLAKDSMVEPDASKRQAMIEQAQEIIAQDQPVVWLYHLPLNVALRDNVEGYVYYPDRLTRVYELSKK